MSTMRYGAVSAGSNGDGDEFDRLTYVRDDGDVESMASSSTAASTGYPRTGKRHTGTLSSGTDSSTAHSRGWTLPWSSVAALALLALVGASVGLAGLHMDPDAGTSSSISSLVTGGAATASAVAKGPVKPTPPLPASPSSTENAPASSDVALDAAAEDTEIDATAAAATTADAAATTSADDAQASAKAAAASTITDVNAAVEVSSPDYGVSQALKHLPWDAVAEAYRDQTIRLLMTYKTSASDEEAVAASEDDVVVKWQILGKKYSGLEATFNAAAIPGVYECTVSVSAAADGTELYSKTFNMAVKYIRREVRSLTEADRTKFFSALKLFYTTEEDAGKKLYGDKFNNAKYFLLKHLNGAGRSDCDHWHDGPAFINKHLAFTLEAEQSLQAIDKTISMPYWEYFSDAYLPMWQQSDVFAHEWYGEASPMNADHAPAGAWADLEVPDGSAFVSSWSIAKEGSLNPYVNAYGHLRSPWNNNPSKHLGRHNMTYGFSIDHMPNCKIMSQCYASSDLSAMTNCLNGVTHGPVHVLIGGAWGQGNTFDDGDINFVRNINKVLYFKNLWRTGYTRCPTSCKEGEPCRCAVPQSYLDEYDVDTIFKNAEIYDMISPHLKNKDEAYKLKVLKAIEDPGVVGEMLTSAAPFDPSFWPIHGQLERILGLKRVRKSQNALKFDETWGFGGASGKFLSGVCDWSRIESVSDLTLPECDFTGAKTCLGHGEHDTLEFTNFLDLKETYTNAEFYEFVHPWSDSLPYTYDKFDFDYCASYGVSVV